MSILDFLIPPVPRSFRGRRTLKIVLRGLHVLAAGIFTGSLVVSTVPSLQARWMAAALISGLALLLLDMHESCAFLLQVRGWFTVAKLLLLGVASRLEPAHAGWLLAILVVASVVSSHAPAHVRYAVPIGEGRFRSSRTRG